MLELTFVLRAVKVAFRVLDDRIRIGCQISDPLSDRYPAGIIVFLQS